MDGDNKKLMAALEYAEKGWLVFPLHSIREGGCSCSDPECSAERQGKHPRTKNGLNDASIDKEIIQEWWKRWPDANIGIRTGEISGISVLDIDPRHGGNFSIEPYVPIETPSACTGGGGFHNYLQYTPHLKTKTNLLPGVDIRNNGGYVVAPPSNHKSGKEYYWEDEELALAICPQWLLDLEEKSKKSQAIKPSDLVIREGSRNKRLTSIAGAMRSRGMCREAIEKGLLAENKDKCKPPLTDSEVKSIANSISKYEPSSDAFKESLEEEKSFPISLADFFQKDIPPVEFVVEGILQKGGRTMISAPPNVGKSALVQNLAIAISRGDDQFLDKFETKKERVLYLDLEMGESALYSRFKKMVGEK